MASIKSAVNNKACSNKDVLNNSHVHHENNMLFQSLMLKLRNFQL